MTDPDLSTADIGFTSAYDLVEGRRAGDFTSVELVSTLLHRIQTIDDCDGGVQSVLAISTDLMDQLNLATLVKQLVYFMEFQFSLKTTSKRLVYLALLDHLH